MGSDGQQAAFVDEVERHRGILFKIANAYARTPEDREDLAQEIVAQLWRAYPRFDGRAAFSTWMYRVCVNVAISFLRMQTRKRHAVVPASQRLLERLALTDAPETDERSELLRDRIERLEPLDRALMLLYLDDYSYADIATTLGISASNVGTKLARIKERLRRDVATART